jgi:signal transduction histidine kinase
VASNVDLQARMLAKIEAALADPDGAATVRPYLERAAGMLDVSREACRRIATIVRSLRSFSRLDEAERKPADLHGGLDATLTLVDHLLKGRVTVRREYGELPAIDCYPNQLNQVFLNLLVNAAQAIEGPGEIRIRTRVAAGVLSSARAAAVVEISDSGTGIAPEHLARIFDPGFTTKGVGVGTGLGLAICYRIIEGHHGKIEVVSTPGRGSTFRILLPLG